MCTIRNLTQIPLIAHKHGLRADLFGRTSTPTKHTQEGPVMTGRGMGFVALIALASASSVLIALAIYRGQQRRRKALQDKGDQRRSSITVEGQELKPPLPAEVVQLLLSTKLCHLSSAGSDHIPHLSLMNFTYLQGEEVLVMTTRRDTKKFELITARPQVAVLVHDFPQLSDSGGAVTRGHTYSITLNGTAKVVEGEEGEKYRALHLRNNPDYVQFIAGENIAVLRITIKTARICNVQDKVKYWDIKQKQAL